MTFHPSEYFLEKNQMAQTNQRRICSVRPFFHNVTNAVVHMFLQMQFPQDLNFIPFTQTKTCFMNSACIVTNILFGSKTRQMVV